MKKQKRNQMIKRVIVIAIAVCVVLALVLPLFVKADVAVGGDVNYQVADYYVIADGPNGSIGFYYGPGIEYGMDYKVDNGEVLHIVETADNIYDQLQWGEVETDSYSRWVRLDHTRPEGTFLENLIRRILQFLQEILDFLEELR